MSPRGLAHPLLIRLLAVALAVVGAGGVGGRAPQAFRAWTDPVAEVSGGARRAPPLERSAPSGVAPAATVPRSLAAIAPAPPAPPPSVRPGHAWPSAGTLRQLLAFKQSRLI